MILFKVHCHPLAALHHIRVLHQSLDGVEGLVRTLPAAADVADKTRMCTAAVAAGIIWGHHNGNSLPAPP